MSTMRKMVSVLMLMLLCLSEPLALKACSTIYSSDSSIERTSNMAQGILDVLNQIGRGFERIYEEDIPTMQEVRGLLGMDESPEEDYIVNFIADREGFIIAHPEGTEDLTGSQHWNVGWGISMVDDVGFVSGLIDRLQQEYSIDADRIYSTGMSNGGFISYELACQLSDRIAAIASVTGSMSLPTFQTCSPARPMPVVQIHGTADAVVPYEGSAISRPIEEVMEYWVSYNNCDMNPIITAIDDIEMTDQTTVEHIVYPNGKNGVTTELFLVEGGTHSWPGSIFGFPGTNYDINASEEIWNFFSRFDINGEIQLSSLEESTIDYDITISPNPAVESIQLCWDWNQSGVLNVSIHDASGRSVLSNRQLSNCGEMDIAPLNKGVYLIKMIDQASGKSLTRKLIRI